MMKDEEGTMMKQNEIGISNQHQSNDTTLASFRITIVIELVDSQASAGKNFCSSSF